MILRTANHPRQNRSGRSSLTAIFKSGLLERVTSYRAVPRAGKVLNECLADSLSSRVFPRQRIGLQKNYFTSSPLLLLEHKDYIKRLRAAILSQLGADGRWFGSVFVGEYSKTKIMWEQQIEVFELRNHPEAKRCYAWVPNDGSSLEPITVLEVPPVATALDAFTQRRGRND